MGRILVKQDTLSDKSAGGILIPPSALDTGGAKVAKVVEVGEEKYVNGHLTGTYPNVSDKVLIDPLGATKVKIGGEELLLVRVEDVLGIIKE